MMIEGDRMLEGKFQRGFTTERLASTIEPRVRQDDGGYYLETLSEQVKVYFEDFYTFLEQVYDRCESEIEVLRDKIADTSPDNSETLSYYRARIIIVSVVRKAALNFYMDGSNFGVIMTPWCFGTVALEKIEVYRERLGRGEAQDPYAPSYPYYVIKYMDEICKATLLDLFDFPEKAFQMRWQYSELLRRYSKVLSKINESLETVLLRIKNYQP